MVKLECKTCKKEFIVSKNRKAAAKFCSYACYWKSMKGKTNPQHSVAIKKYIKNHPEEIERLRKIGINKGEHRGPTTEFKKYQEPHNKISINTANVMDLHKAGFSAYEIADKLNVSQGVVLRILHEQNIPLRKGHYYKHKEETKQILREKRLKQKFPKKRNKY